MGGFADRENNRKQKSVVASMISDTPQEQTAGRGRPKEERETKKRISLAVLPSLYKDIGKIAYVERRSISEVISECIEKYIADNESKLKEYEKIKRD